MPFPMDQITELITKNSDIVNNILISSIWSGMRYLNDIRNGTETFKTSLFLLTIVIGGWLWFWLYWIISWVFWITNPAIISSISFVIWLLWREVINTIVKISPDLLTKFLPGILQLLLNKWNIQQIAVPIQVENESESNINTNSQDSNSNNLPDA